MLRFYGMSYDEGMALPIRAFWFMSDCIDRIQAQEDQRLFRATSHATHGGDQTQEYLEKLDKQVGEIYVFDKTLTILAATPDENAFDDLRALAMMG